MKKIIKSQSFLAFSFFLISSVLVFYPFFFKGEIPIAGDVILGGYYPWLDYKWDNKQTIYPVLNNSISDSVTSFYPWKYEAIKQAKQGIFPLFDQSSYMGGPLFSTGVTGLFYPLNFLFIVLPFNIAWGLLVSLTPLLSGFFFYIWIRSKGISFLVSILSGFCFAYSSFIGLQVSFINSAHSVLWLPLVLWCIDKLILKFNVLYFLACVFALFASLNAGFFQGSLYLFAVSFLYLLFSLRKNLVKALNLFIPFLFAISLSSILIFPFLNLIGQSSRISNYGTSAINSQIFNFFVEPVYLITTFVPDFLGNPGKWNYWGNPNYYEFNNFIGYASILGVAVIFTNKKKVSETIFFIFLFVFSLIFATKNPISTFPYENSWPLISSLTPSRLLFLVQFCLLTISAIGLDMIVKRTISFKKLVVVIGSIFAIYTLILALALLGQKGIWNPFPSFQTNFSVSIRNSLYSLGIFTSLIAIFLLYYKFKLKPFIAVAIFITCLDLIRQTGFSRPFIKADLLYPKTESITFLQQDNNYRFMITDPQLLPSNLQIIYSLSSIDGVGPIFPDRYNQFISSLNENNITDSLTRYPRTIFFHNYNSNALDMLNIKYIVSLKELKNPSLKEVFAGQSVKIYQNPTVLPKAWIVKNIKTEKSSLETIKILRDKNFDPKKEVLTDKQNFENKFSEDDSKVLSISERPNEIHLITKGDGVLVLSYQYLKDWKAFIDNKPISVIPVNNNLMGIVLPSSGTHSINLKYEPESFNMGFKVSSISFLILITYSFFILRGQKNTTGQ